MQKQIPLFDAPPLVEAKAPSVITASEPTAVGVVAQTAPAANSPIDVGSKYSKYVVYVDESGDHGMANLDPNYPVFVLAFCVFHKGHYTRKVVADIEDLKFRYFGHDLIVLHENEILKAKGEFKRFNNLALRNQFMSDLTDVIDGSNFILISCVIDKSQLKARHANPANPYHIALGFCLETLFEFLSEKKQQDLVTHVVCRAPGQERR